MRCIKWIFAILFADSFSKIHCVGIKSNILGPFLPNKPFSVTWDVASEKCEEKYGISLYLDHFGIRHNTKNGWKGNVISIFYENDLGLFPHFNDSGQPINGGLPQEIPLFAHLDKVKKDVYRVLPDLDFEGLAVIDWRSWLPLWDQICHDNMHMHIYRDKSIQKVKAEHPDWQQSKIISQTKSEYESGAKTLMKFTLRLTKKLRPKAKWGFYLYPDCYNYDSDGHKIDLRCTNYTKNQDDKLQWLFNESTALYPSAYLTKWFKHNLTALYFVAYRVLEAVRVDSNRPEDTSIPIFLYHSVAYPDTKKFLNLFDLRDTIGVASLLGASGVVIWGGYDIANTAEECQNLGNYISSILGPFVQFISDAASKCSHERCNNHERCVLSHFPGYKDNLNERTHLEVQEVAKTMSTLNEDFSETFNLSLQKPGHYPHYIVCQCYEKWTGYFCNEMH
uniref:LOW QUALITY PROTEIN: hyaluronidase-like n=1 Tax=Styela clava TaxID=7725 RepID=UPI00193AC82C|nr:LOW QUALITY PROTEIN: hyaluronidase-like [Styela clava]